MPRQECNKVERQECRQIPREVCNQVPREQCVNVPRQVARQECSQIPRQECRQVPREACEQVPKQVQHSWLIDWIKLNLRRATGPRNDLWCFCRCAYRWSGSSAATCPARSASRFPRQSAAPCRASSAVRCACPRTSARSVPPPAMPTDPRPPRCRTPTARRLCRPMAESSHLICFQQQQ